MFVIVMKDVEKAAELVEEEVGDEHDAASGPDKKEEKESEAKTQMFVPDERSGALGTTPTPSLVLLRGGRRKSDCELWLEAFRFLRDEVHPATYTFYLMALGVAFYFVYSPPAFLHGGDAITGGCLAVKTSSMLAISMCICIFVGYMIIWLFNFGIERYRKMEKGKSWIVMMYYLAFFVRSWIAILLAKWATVFKGNGVVASTCAENGDAFRSGAIVSWGIVAVLLFELCNLDRNSWMLVLHHVIIIAGMTSLYEPQFFEWLGAEKDYGKYMGFIFLYAIGILSSTFNEIWFPLYHFFGSSRPDMQEMIVRYKFYWLSLCLVIPQFAVPIMYLFYNNDMNPLLYAWCWGVPMFNSVSEIWILYIMRNLMLRKNNEAQQMADGKGKWSLGNHGKVVPADTKKSPPSC